MIRMPQQTIMLILLAIVFFQPVAMRPLVAGLGAAVSLSPTILHQTENASFGINFAPVGHCQTHAADSTCSQIALTGAASLPWLATLRGRLVRRSSDYDLTDWGTTLDPPPPRV